ncbi:MAG: hypothetical protein IJE43_16580 [Alphaproteobacteria bacterium]|nr:hypothetical protein [Alphaproteobacteria bacterium]
MNKKKQQMSKNALSKDLKNNASCDYALDRIITDLSRISRLIESYDYDEECFIYEPFYKIKEDVNGL